MNILTILKSDSLQPLHGRSIFRIPTSVLLLIITFPVMSSCSKKNGDIAGSGTVEAYEVQISPIYPGRIRRILVSEGDTFKQGDALVDLQNDEMQADLDYSTAGYEAARTQIAQAKADYENAMAERKRGEAMFASDGISRQDLDRLITREKVAASRYQAAGAQADQVQAAIRRSRTRVRETTLYAPISGVVLSRNFEPGEVAMTGSSILSVADMSTMRLNVFIGERDLPGVRSGSKANVSVDGFEKSFEGIVESISDRAEFTPKNVQTADARSRLVYEVRIRLPNPERILKQGMPADARIDGPGR